ncbi:MAG: zinc ribbon domain-containing protein [Planctomycetia bacterium]|nr:zinc ribbon domain-containing protein [Planctomycetia bacterium]
MSYAPGFCSVCGTPLGSDVRFCPNCGMPVGQTESPRGSGMSPEAVLLKTLVPYPEQLAINCPTLPPGAFKASFWLCVLTWLLYVISSMVWVCSIIMVAPDGGNRDPEMTCFMGLGMFFFLVLHVIMVFRFLYRCWRLIQDGYAHTTPGKAVGFNFIPIFNIYWIFISVYCLAKDLNAYAARYQIAAPRAWEGLTLTGLIFLLIPHLQLFGFLLLTLGSFSMARTAEAIQNARRP